MQQITDRFIMKDCPTEENTHISWKFTPNKKTICRDIDDGWHVKHLMLEVDDGSVTVPFTEFQSHAR